ncbi:MAG: radical SAM protein [Candidatus Omnitrophota bacterium]
MRRIRKALLFIPPAITFKDWIDINPLPPLGLGYIGAVLEDSGIEVKIVDCLMEGWDNRVEIGKNLLRIGLSFEEIENVIMAYGPDIIGVNNLFTKQRANAHKIYEVAKTIDKGIITIAGGAHPTVMPELVLSDTKVDYVILGEGERAIVSLVRSIEGKQDISGLDGVGYRSNGRLIILPKTKFIEDLDSLPFPAMHLLNIEKYFGLKSSHGTRRKNKFSPIITSRGCPAKCTFCSASSVWGRGFRPRSPENVIRELKLLKTRYGIEEIMFEDDNLTLDPKRAEAIFDGITREKLNLEWDTPNGVAAWTLSEKLIYKMKQSGCRTINFAIESGNQYVLDNIIKKPLILKKVKPLVKYAKKIGLNVGIFLVMGMPHETAEQIWDSFRLAEELGIFTPHISVATPYPGSELYDICREEGLLRPDFSLDDLYIRSFSISTPELSNKQLKKTISEGEKYLLFSSLKKKPFMFLRTLLGKFIKNK